jgi:hypothetical protein
MSIAKLASPTINWQKEGKAKVNEIIDALNGADTTVSRAVLAAMLSDLPTSNPGAGLFYLNSGVVTAGS